MLVTLKIKAAMIGLCGGADKASSREAGIISGLYGNLGYLGLPDG